MAGAAAGVAVDSPLAPVSGIAPRAFLGNYNVFGSNGTTTSAAVIAAINAAVADGMDVINLSLGGPAVDPDRDPEQMVIASATALGFVFVIAAGNAGPGRGSITSPGTSPAAITVGASSNARTFGGAIELTSNSPEFPVELSTILAVAGNGNPIEDEIGPFPVVTISAADPTREACTPLPAGSLAGVVGPGQAGPVHFRHEGPECVRGGWRCRNDCLQQCGRQSHLDGFRYVCPCPTGCDDHQVPMEKRCWSSWRDRVRQAHRRCWLR